MGLKVKISLKFLGLVDLEWEPDTVQQEAAWSLYVELVTRITVQPLAADEGLVREALNSIYSLFQTTRDILKDSGPKVGARRKSVGGIAIEVLNIRLRPFLAKWHPMLLDHEACKPVDVSSKEHEVKWQYHDEIREELDELRKDMSEYANALAKIAGVSPED